jgi:hypothetical protein
MSVETIPVGEDRDGRLRVERRTRGGSVALDLWPTRFNLGPEGQAACQAILERYARRFMEARRRRSSTSVLFGAGPTFIWISRLERHDVEPCLSELLAVVLADLVPLRWVDDREGSPAA